MRGERKMRSCVFIPGRVHMHQIGGEILFMLFKACIDARDTLDTTMSFELFLVRSCLSCSEGHVHTEKSFDPFRVIQYLSLPLSLFFLGGVNATY